MTHSPSTPPPRAPSPAPAGTALIVFAKLPAPGSAKTRLIPALGAEGAANLARRMLEHAVNEGSLAGFDHVELCIAPDNGIQALTSLRLPASIAVTAQGPGDLGERMDRALARRLETHARALLIGTDAPAIDANRLRQAAQALQEHDAVFIPALDGGYALVGLRRPGSPLFRGVEWSTPDVMATTRRLAHVHGITLALLDPVADIDHPDDLAHLPPHWLAT